MRRKTWDTNRFLAHIWRIIAFVVQWMPCSVGRDVLRTARPLMVASCVPLLSSVCLSRSGLPALNGWPLLALKGLSDANFNGRDVRSLDSIRSHSIHSLPALTIRVCGRVCAIGAQGLAITISQASAQERHIWTIKTIIICDISSYEYICVHKALHHIISSSLRFASIAFPVLSCLSALSCLSTQLILVFHLSWYNTNKRQWNHCDLNDRYNPL